MYASLISQPDNHQCSTNFWPTSSYLSTNQANANQLNDCQPTIDQPTIFNQLTIKQPGVSSPANNQQPRVNLTLASYLANCPSFLSFFQYGIYQSFRFGSQHPWLTSSITPDLGDLMPSGLLGLMEHTHSHRPTYT